MFRRPRKAVDVPVSSWDRMLLACTTDVRRLDNVIRFSSIPVTFSESTASHSYWVSLFSLMIWQKLEEYGWKTAIPDLGEVLRYAITHDSGEALSGDIVRPMKYSTPEMKKEVDRSEALLMNRLFPYEARRAVIFTPSPATKAIVKAADWLSLWQFMRREAARHNLEIIPYYRSMVKDLRDARDHSVPEIRGLYDSMVGEAELVEEDCFGAFADSPRWTRSL